MKCEVCGKTMTHDESVGFIHNFTYHGFCSDECRSEYRRINKV